MTPASSARRGVVETPGGPASTPGHPEPRCPPAGAPAMVGLRPRGPTGAGITWLEVPRSQSVSPRTSPPPCPPNQACGPGCCHSALPPSQWQGVGWGLGGVGFLGLLQTGPPSPGHPHLDLQGRPGWTSQITGWGGRCFKGSLALCCGDRQASRDPQKCSWRGNPAPVSLH